MPSSRRAFAAAVALVLAGCASPGSDAPDEPATDAAADAPRPGEPDVPRPGDPDAPGPGAQNARSTPSAEPTDSPFRWWSWHPDVVVLNHDTDAVTAYLHVYDADWLWTADRETVSLRARTPGSSATTASVAVLESAGPESVLDVQTADGVRGVHPYPGGRRRGVSVHLYADRVRFEDESL